MSTTPREPSTPEPAPENYDEPVVLEEDETVPPRPEEEVADQLRADPAP